MYESPITLTEQIADEVRAETERILVEHVRKIGFNVDKCELERALLYDRQQYEKAITTDTRTDAQALPTGCRVLSACRIRTCACCA